MEKVQLIKMTLEDYNKYINNAISNYEDNLMKNGRFNNLKDAHEYAVWDFGEIYTDGFNTANVYSYNIVVNEKKVGFICLLNEDKTEFPGEIFITDFEVYEEFRNKGYGSKSLLLAGDCGRELGLKEIRLGVMNYNTNAKKLYERTGYTIFKKREFDCVMRKFL